MSEDRRCGDRRCADRRRGDRRAGQRRPTHGRGPTPAPAAGGPGTILVVDDEPMVLNLLQAALQQHGYTVLLATSGVEALEVVQKNWDPIHLVLTDMVMSGMDGLELARRLALDHPAVKVLFMSGHHPDEADPKGEARSSAPYLSKPFSIEVLLGTIRSLLAQEGNRTSSDRLRP